MTPFTGYSCPTQTSQSGCCDWFSSCRNPLYAFDHPSECGGSMTLESVALVPANQTITKGRSGYVRVIATFSDGRSADVTGESVLVSGDSSVVSVPGTAAGLLDANDAGEVTVTGAWRGRVATGSVEVVEAACVTDAPWDVVVVVDDGAVFVASPVAVVRNEQSVMVRAMRRYNSSAAAAYPASVLGLMLSMDLVDGGGVASYLGTGWDAQVSPGTAIGTSRTGQDRIWTPSDGWKGEIAAVAPFISAGSGIGPALIDAWSALMGPGGREEAHKLVVLYSTGGETVCSPSAMSAADVLVAAGIHVAVITPLKASDTHIQSFCFPGLPAHAMLSQVASSTCLFLDGQIPMEFSFANVLRLSCEDCGGYGYGY